MREAASSDATTSSPRSPAADGELEYARVRPIVREPQRRAQRVVQAQERRSRRCRLRQQRSAVGAESVHDDSSRTASRSIATTRTLAVLDDAQQRRSLAIDQRACGVEGGVMDVLTARRRDERVAGGAQDALALHGPLLLAHEAGDAHDDERRTGRSTPMLTTIRRSVVLELLRHLDHRRDHRRGQQQSRGGAA